MSDFLTLSGRLLAAFLVLLAALPASGQGSVSLDPRGPVAGSEGKVRIDESGVVYTALVHGVPADFGEWDPHWIWLSASTAATTNARFRQDFELAPGSLPQTAFAQVSADKTYRLWVNGRLVSRGPDDPGSDEILSQDWSHRWLYTVIDVAPYLRSGTNTLAVEVLGSHTPGYSLHHAGFAFHLAIAGPDHPAMIIDSERGWHAQAITAYGEGAMPLPDGAPAGSKPEIGLTYDARQDDPGWRSPGSARDWPPAAPIPSVWGTLSPSQLPPRMEAAYPARAVNRLSSGVTVSGTGNTAHIHLDGNGSFSVDFDRVLSAYSAFRVRGPAGTVVTIEPAETITRSHPRRSAQITLREGLTYFEHPAYDAFSTIRVMVSNASGPVDFDDVRAVFTSYPVAYRGAFVSSDEHLNQLWTSARWLTQICMQDRYLDSPNHQEPIGDFGDYLIEAVENDYAFDQQGLTAQDLRKFGELLDHAGSVNFHTSYSLLWLQMLMEYYDHTGDKALLLAEEPTVDRLLAHFATFRGTNGLLSEAPNYMFMDWVTIAGVPTHHPPAEIGQGYLTAFYYRALGDGARLAKLAGDAAKATAYEDERTALAQAFERELWDPAAGLYRDGKPNLNHQPLGRWLPADKGLATHSVHVNALAVLYDLAPKNRQADILNRLNEAGPLNVQPYFMHFVFAAELHAGVFDRWAVGQMQRWKLNPETRTFSEMFNGGDFSHGWGGTPLIQMSAHILGVSPAAPNYDRILLAPHPSGLTFAKGVVPTAHGDVDVAWTSKPGAFAVQVTSPKGVPLDFRLEGPLMTARTVMVDGHTVNPTDMHLVLTGGQHSIELAGIDSAR